MRRRESQGQDLNQLGSESRSVLAVLVLAALWPARFPAGWISVTEFGRCGLYLGDRLGRESLKAAIRRGLRDLRDSRAVPAISHRRTPEHDPSTGRLLRDWDRRLGSRPGRFLAVWLRTEGRDYLAPDLWREFISAGRATGITPRRAMTDTLQTLLRRVSRSLRSEEHTWAPGSPERKTLRRVRRAVHEGLRSHRDLSP
jgi:hypothetical protein